LALLIFANLLLGTVLPLVSSWPCLARGQPDRGEQLAQWLGPVVREADPWECATCPGPGLLVSVRARACSHTPLPSPLQVISYHTELSAKRQHLAAAGYSCSGVFLSKHALLALAPILSLLAWQLSHWLLPLSSWCRAAWQAGAP
jgi:hypothetical protein